VIHIFLIFCLQLSIFLFHREVFVIIILEVEYASYNLGIFLCRICSQIHRSLGTHISKIKHLRLDNWEDSQIKQLMDVGNRRAKYEYEIRIPASYRVPKAHESHLQILLEQFIRAKYERKEFMNSRQTPSFTLGRMEGYLMKRGKEDNKYHPRKFVLNEADDTLRYYVKEEKNPKAILRISELNVVFARQFKGDVVNKNCLQITYLSSVNSTRHIFVYHEDSEIIVNWYQAIRCSKFHFLQVAHPNANESDLLPLLTRDFAREGWLMKTGPRPTDAYRRRWCTLDNRKLMYHNDILDGFPKGEIFIGSSMDGYATRVGVADDFREQGFSFSLFTPERIYNFSATTSQDRDEWMNEIQKVIDRPMTTADISLCSRLERKRNTMQINFLSGR
jgi:Arf-GAP with dual PH domain-containing protein